MKDDPRESMPGARGIPRPLSGAWEDGRTATGHVLMTPPMEIRQPVGPTVYSTPAMTGEETEP